MFTLTIHDRKGVKLNLGDTVKVSDGKAFTFYAEVKYLEDEKIIAPFHTFSFHSFEKVDSLPDGAIQSNEERYKIWYVDREIAEVDSDAESFKRYLMDWRECETLLDKGCYRITIS